MGRILNNRKVSSPEKASFHSLGKQRLYLHKISRAGRSSPCIARSEGISNPMEIGRNRNSEAIVLPDEPIWDIDRFKGYTGDC